MGAEGSFCFSGTVWGIICTFYFLRMKLELQLLLSFQSGTTLVFRKSLEYDIRETLALRQQA